MSLSGTIEFNYGFKRMTNPILTHLEEAGEAHGIIQAFHGSINKLSPSIVKRMIAHALEEVRGLYDPFPLSGLPCDPFPREHRRGRHGAQALAL